MTDHEFEYVQGVFTNAGRADGSARELVEAAYESLLGYEDANSMENSEARIEYWLGRLDDDLSAETFVPAFLAAAETNQGSLVPDGDFLNNQTAVGTVRAQVDATITASGDQPPTDASSAGAALTSLTTAVQGQIGGDDPQIDDDLTVTLDNFVQTPSVVEQGDEDGVTIDLTLTNQGEDTVAGTLGLFAEGPGSGLLPDTATTDISLDGGQTDTFQIDVDTSLFASGEAGVLVFLDDLLIGLEEIEISATDSPAAFEVLDVTATDVTDPDETNTIDVNIENTGGAIGEEFFSIEAFNQDMEDPNVIPFLDSLTLQPGDTGTVSIEYTANDLGLLFAGDYTVSVEWADQRREFEDAFTVTDSGEVVPSLSLAEGVA